MGHLGKNWLVFRASFAVEDNSLESFRLSLIDIKSFQAANFKINHTTLINIYEQILHKSSANLAGSSAFFSAVDNFIWSFCLPLIDLRSVSKQ